MKSFEAHRVRRLITVVVKYGVGIDIDVVQGCLHYRLEFVSE